MKVLDVAVGIVRDSLGQVLIAKRPAAAHQGNLWEFPGGKCESGETPQDALSRELAEELAIAVDQAEALCVIEHDYGDKRVRLHVQTVTGFTGIPRGAEGQPLRWVKPFQLWRYKFPAANRPILRSIALPRRMAVAGSFKHTSDFEESFQRSISRGADGLYLRLAPAGAVADWLHPLASELCERHDCLLFTPIDLPVRPGQGLHWRTHQWASGHATGYPQSAAVHCLAELQAAQAAGADLLLISPVRPTTSHPSVKPLGWEGFGAIARAAHVPCLALGGIEPSDYQQSLAYGGSGVAGITGFWDL